MIKKGNVFLWVLILCSCFIMAQESKTEYQIFVKRFIENIKNEDKQAIGDLIVYPLQREYPIPDIETKEDFIKRYDEIFDSNLKNNILKSDAKKDWSDMGLRGTMLHNGNIWMDIDGRLTAVNYQSKFETDLRDKLIAEQKKGLDESISFFKTPICILETPKFKIRIDNLGNNNYRYVSWSGQKEMTEKPDLILYRGELVVEGIGGNHQYEFKKDNYTYECSIIVLGNANAPAARLKIYQGEKVIHSENAKIIAK